MIQTPFYRTYQFVLKIAAYFLHIHEPKVEVDVGILKNVSDILLNEGHKRPLVVIDKGIFSIGLHEDLVNSLKEKGLEYFVYSDVVANPTISNINDGLKIFKDNNCDSIVALGGGSAMDTAKVIGALAVNPKKKVEDLKGLLHVHKRIPYFIAIPTTAGTGSEATIAAVVIDEKTHHKYAINDPHLIPDFAILDSKFLIKLPPKITSTTGMDALTHAVEAYIGRSNTRKTKNYALKAVKLIDEHLYASYVNGTDYSHRIGMQEAAFLAGVAFTRAYVGYVHAIAHSLGGKYNVPHGLANAIILPYVLEAFGKKAYRKLARLSDEISLCEKSSSKEEKAKAFIAYIRELNKKMEIPEKFDISYDENAVDEMAKNAFKEGNPLYPVPKEFNLEDFKAIYRKILL